MSSTSITPVPKLMFVSAKTAYPSEEDCKFRRFSWFFQGGRGSRSLRVGSRHIPWKTNKTIFFLILLVLDNRYCRIICTVIWGDQNCLAFNASRYHIFTVCCVGIHTYTVFVVRRFCLEGAYIPIHPCIPLLQYKRCGGVIDKLGCCDHLCWQAWTCTVQMR